VFLSLNSAGRRRNFDQSSNFLAVRLAEIFGGRHLVVLEHTDPGAEDEYRERIKNIDLLICSAGGQVDSLLLKHAEEHHVVRPENMVGDLAFIPLDSEGWPVEGGVLAPILKSLSPHPDYKGVLRIARDESKEVMVILNESASKLSVAHAILSAGLATHCVLGISLAALLLSGYGSAAPPPRGAGAA
jgi:hypothetical protein